MPGDRPGEEEKMRPEYRTNKMTPYDVQNMRRTMTQQQICDYYGINITTLYRWGKRHNVDLKRLTDWEVAEGIGTKTPKELAYEYNVSLTAIYRRLKIMGICTKQPGQRGGTK